MIDKPINLEPLMGLSVTQPVSTCDGVPLPSDSSSLQLLGVGRGSSCFKITTAEIYNPESIQTIVVTWHLLIDGCSVCSGLGSQQKGTLAKNP